MHSTFLFEGRQRTVHVTQTGHICRLYLSYPAAKNVFVLRLQFMHFMGCFMHTNNLIILKINGKVVHDIIRSKWRGVFDAFK